MTKGAQFKGLRAVEALEEFAYELELSEGFEPMLKNVREMILDIRLGIAIEQAFNRLIESREKVQA